LNSQGTQRGIQSLSLAELDQRIGQCLLKDRHRLRSLLRRLTDSSLEPADVDRRSAVLAEQISRSLATRNWRAAQMPPVSVDDTLPIAAHADEIIRSIQSRQVVVVCGQTGSGKSTQLPKMCLQAGYGISGMIGHTQPRRIAARTIASRIADELRVALGQQVGFKIRFTDKSNDATLVKVMTDGILLAETRADRFLEQYEVIILDEAHERSLNVDFLIGFVHRLLRQRRDLRVIITSATMDASRFAAHFHDQAGPAPIIDVAGRMYPVEVRYRPADLDEDQAPDIADAIVAAIGELSDADSGDILVFLPTERDIREIAKRLRGEFHSGGLRGTRFGSSTRILPLYARLSAAEQNRIFEVGPQRRIVLATNVAESSLTVPGIRHVIDTGTARISRYSPRLKIQRLPIERISRASADQRKGRCGRVAPGVCIRLYSEDDYASRDEFTTPEIRRTNLASVILQAQVLGLGDVEQIPFPDPPRPDAIRDGYRTLFELGAVDSKHQLTRLGEQLSGLPVDPRIARMIVAARQEGCLAETLIVAAALEIQDPRERPLDKQQAADAAHAQFQDVRSDFLSFLKLWDFFDHLKATISRSKLRKACQQRFLSWTRMHEWQEIHRELLKLVQQSGWRPGPRRNDYDSIHRTILAGLLSAVALRTGEHEYTGAGGVKFRLWPGSGLFQQRPQWVVAAEIVETSQRFARTVAVIDPAWIEPLAAHLLKRSYRDPHWHEKTESVMAYEKLSLFGLPVIERRTGYGPLDPETARTLFIQHGLVEGKMRSTFPFLQKNRELLKTLESLAARTRDRRLVVDEYALFAQYNRRIPSGVFDVASLRRWLKRAPLERNNQLTFSQADFTDVHTSELKDQFPDRLKIGSIEAPAEYNFQPGGEQDGVTITVPVEALNQLNTANLDWLVPGFVEPKVLALIRSLPKVLRRNLVPAPDVAQRVSVELTFGRGDFLAEVAARLSQIADAPISVDDFRLDQLADHFKVNVQVTDAQGTVLATGRDPIALREQFGSQRATVEEIRDDRWNRDQVTAWDFGDIPPEIIIQRAATRVPLYPAVVDSGDSVRLELLDSKEAAQIETRLGIMRLFAIKNRKLLRSQAHWLPGWDRMKMLAWGVIDAASLDRQVQDLIAMMAIEQQPLPARQDEFEGRVARASELIATATQEVASFLPALFEGLHAARLARERISAAKWKEAREDIDRQLNGLLADNRLAAIPLKWLRQFPRYFRGIAYRIEKLTSGGQARDQECMHEIERWQSLYDQRQQRLAKLRIHDAALDEYRWMLEEYRISLFAQPLGTHIKISGQRLEKQLQTVRTD
jgi:ATP-dependent helicase HrpA